MLEPMKKITFKEIREAAKSGYNATVIINGESYILDPSNDDFINGVLFAAAAIEDRRARFNFMPTKTKKAAAERRTLTDNDMGIVRFLEHIILPGAGLDTRIQEYNNGNTWKVR